MHRFIENQKGGVAIYAAMAAVVGIGATTLAVDYGRMALVKVQMQNRADAGAMAAAVYLDGKDGARTRAQNVAINAMSDATSLASDGTDLTVQGVTFYSDLTTDPPTVATTDLDAKFVKVELTAKTVDFFFQPVLAAFGSGTAPSSRQMHADAVAGPSPFICNAPPLMMCDPAEDDPSRSLDLDANIGKQVILKEAQSGTPWAAGNFGLLALPDGSSGASAIEQALASVHPASCYGLDVTTAPGSKTNDVKDGINARFDLPGGGPNPAPDVINYPRDQALLADSTEYFGDGNWDIDAYWSAKHGGATPSELAGATRYQTYLYEQGLEFARNGNLTLYPVPEQLPDGYQIVSPGGPDIPVAADPANADDPDYDGVPSQAVASNGFARRLINVAVLECKADGINGHGTYPTNGRFVEIFLTEDVKDPPDAAILGEIVKRLTPTSSPDYHANVRLVE